MRRSARVMSGLCAVGLVGGMLLGTRTIHAHCDTMDGPVVSAVEAALARGDVTPDLKWVHTADEPEIRHAFELAMAVRNKGPEARELADRSFLGTLVRVHRAGEGVAFEGIKSVGTPIGEAVEAADKALASGSVDEVVKMVTTHVEHGIRERFARAAEAWRSAERNVEAGPQSGRLAMDVERQTNLVWSGGRTV